MTAPFLGRDTLAANGIRQSFLRFGGQGQPLIILPGITSPAQTWAFVGARLGHHFDTYIPDLRGRGLSEAGPHLRYDLDAYAEDIAGLAEVLGLQDFVLLGHSMGARIGIRLARRDSTRIARLVLVDPPMSGPGRRPYPTALGWFLESIDTAHRRPDPEAMRAFVPSWSEVHLRLRLEWLRCCDKDAVIASHAGFQEEDIHQDLPHLTIPTLLVVAGKGGVVLPEDLEEIRSLLPGIAVEHVPDAGHMIPWEDEAGFFRAIGPFLGGV